MKEGRISAYMDWRLERWALHLYRQGNVATAPFRNAGMPAPQIGDQSDRPLVDPQFAETQAMVERLPAEDQMLVHLWYGGADRRELPARLRKSGERKPDCLRPRESPPEPAHRPSVRFASAGGLCACQTCGVVPSIRAVYHRLGKIHRALWALLDERRKGPRHAVKVASRRVLGDVDRGRRATLAAVAPMDDGGATKVVLPSA